MREGLGVFPFAAMLRIDAPKAGPYPVNRAFPSASVGPVIASACGVLYTVPPPVYGAVAVDPSSEKELALSTVIEKTPFAPVVAGVTPGALATLPVTPLISTVAPE